MQMLQPVLFIEGQVVFALNESGSLLPLNHDFLLRHSVVPEDWAPQVERSFSTPVVSQVCYKNGFKIVYEPRKLSVLMPLGGPVLQDNRVPEELAFLQKVSQKSLELCQDVQALGLNFLIARNDLPFEKLADRFLKNLPACDNHKARPRELSWVYDLGEAQRLDIISSEAYKNKSTPVSLFRVNRHYECKGKVQKHMFLNDINTTYKMVAQLVGGI